MHALEQQLNRAGNGKERYENEDERINGIEQEKPLEGITVSALVLVPMSHGYSAWV